MALHMSTLHDVYYQNVTNHSTYVIESFFSLFFLTCKQFIQSLKILQKIKFIYLKTG